MNKSLTKALLALLVVVLSGSIVSQVHAQEARHTIEHLVDYDQDRLEAIERWMALGREGANALISPRKRRTLGSSQKGAASRGFSVVRRSIPEEGEEGEGEGSSSVMALVSYTYTVDIEDDDGNVISFTTYFDYAESLDSVLGYWAQSWYEDGVFIEDSGEDLTVIHEDGFTLFYRDSGMIREDGELVEWWNFEETTLRYDNVMEITGAESNSDWEGVETLYVDRLTFVSEDTLRYELFDEGYSFEYLLVNSGNNMLAVVEEEPGVSFFLIWYNNSIQKLFSNRDGEIANYSDGLLFENGDTLFYTIERSEPTSYGFLTTTQFLSYEAMVAGTSAPEDYYVDRLVYTYMTDGRMDSTKTEEMCYDEQGPTGEFCSGETTYFTYALLNIATSNEALLPMLPWSNDLTGYPNPAVAKVDFELPNGTAPVRDVEVYDLLGKRVLSLGDEAVEMSSTTITIDVGTLANGVYFLRGGSEEGMHTGRFVVLK